MTDIDRRAFVAGLAALAAVPARAAAAPSGAAEVIIVGAGAAGIAAARRLDAASKSYVLIEASSGIGGRCITDTQTFGAPFDRGAHWIRNPTTNPLAKLAAGAGLDVYRAPGGQRVRIGRRYAREGELEDFLANLVKANRAISDAAHGKTDASCAQALPAELGDWRATIEFVLGGLGSGKDLAQVSALDMSKSIEREVDSFCKQGYGALLAKLAEGIAIERNSAVKSIASRRRGAIEVETTQGTYTTEALIVTVSTGVLASGAIKFTPDLPKRHLDAAAKLSLGHYERIALQLDDNPLQLPSDDLVYEKATGTKTAALLANVSGSNLCYVDVAGPFARELANAGKDAMTAFATDWLASLYGNDIKRAIKKSDATQWVKDPFVRGAFSAAAPGAQNARKILAEPLRERIFFAGEATSEAQWGTVGGAWESGERAAAAVLKILSPRTRRTRSKTPKRRRKR